MIKLRCIICAILSSVLVLIIAAQLPAQDSAEAPKPKTKIVYKEKSYYDYEDSLVNGNLRKPDGSFIFRKSQSTFSSALNLNRSFMPELRESAKSAR